MFKNNFKNKFGNVKTVIDNLKFDSKLEAEFYIFIKQRMDIELVRCQPTVTLMPKNLNNEGEEIKVTAIKYKPDFEIIHNGKTIMVDAKGIETTVFKLKINLYKRTNSPPLIIAKSLREFQEELSNIN